MDGPSFSREPLDVGFSSIPHGLWTLDAPKGAIVLLGWLHSHSDEFLKRLTLNNCRDAMGSSQVADWLVQLESLGLVAIIKAKVKNRPSRVVLRAEAWKALFGRVSRNRPTERADIGLPGEPISAYIEDHVEDHEKTTSSRPAPSAEPVVVELCELFRKSLIDRDCKDQPVTKQALRDMDGLHRIDGRSEAEIRAVIGWLVRNPDPVANFWRGVVLSPGSLRKNWDKMRLKMEALRNGAKGSHNERHTQAAVIADRAGGGSILDAMFTSTPQQKELT